MLDLLCQVCCGPANHTRQGWLFVMGRNPADMAADWAEGVRVTSPPVCEPCAAVALRHCPHLADPVGVRARLVRHWGIFGGIFLPGPDGFLRQRPTDDYVPYRVPAAWWCLASQLVVELRYCTPVELP
jgi:hypothetical protein